MEYLGIYKELKELKESGQPVIISLFDYSGNWAKPWAEAGYKCLLVDIKHGCDLFRFYSILNYAIVEGFMPNIYGVLAAPPCTDFSASGAWTWKKKDTIQPADYEYDSFVGLEFENTTEYSEFLVTVAYEIVTRLKEYCGLNFWAFENPVGRFDKRCEFLRPFKKGYFQPCDYGHTYTKKTGLWGEFNYPAPTEIVKPVQGSKMLKYGGKTEKTKAARSITPAGFAKAFFYANHKLTGHTFAQFSKAA